MATTISPNPALTACCLDKAFFDLVDRIEEIESQCVDEEKKREDEETIQHFLARDLNLECPLCMNVFLEPVKTPCKHIFCR